MRVFAILVMSVRYLAMSSLEDGDTAVPETSLLRASRISCVPARTRLAMSVFAERTLPAASAIHAEIVVKLRACSLNCVAAVPYPPETASAVFPCSSPILDPASVALSD